MKPLSAVLASTVVVSVALLGCGAQGGGGETGSEESSYASEETTYSFDDQGGFSSEAERTRAMEEKAAEIDVKRRQVMEGGLSEAEMMQATQEIEALRQELNEMAEEPLADPQY